MSERLDSLPVLALDCQASGATPLHGDLLELGWARCTSEVGVLATVRSHWIVPRTARPIGRAVRELTGWSEACRAEAVPDAHAWSLLLGDVTPRPGSGPAPTIIHFARFELPFLIELHERAGAGSAFPLDAVCLHAIAARLFPELPRRNIRALAGYLGHSPTLLRRSAGHVDATAFIWSALVPRLAAEGVATWSELKAWLASTRIGARPKRRSYPLAPERRRALPDACGVYRFVRCNGDVIYVGKATSLKKRVASHFNSKGPRTERGLELLSQVHDIVFTQTPSLLEAALLESDEIKRLDPPYNVQLRSGDRCAWFVAEDLSTASPLRDAVHRLGPLPSERSLLALGACAALCDGAEPSPALLSAALAVPQAFLPDATLFAEGWRLFIATLGPAEGSPRRRLARAALSLWLERGRSEPTASAEDAAPDAWDLARVQRRLERNLVQSGLLSRRARALTLLVDADIAFREHAAANARALVVADAAIVEQRELEAVHAIATLPVRPLRSLAARQSVFDAAAYDRLRVLLTELHRIHDEGGEIVLRVGRHLLHGESLTRVLRAT